MAMLSAGKPARAAAASDYSKLAHWPDIIVSRAAVSGRSVSRDSRLRRRNRNRRWQDWEVHGHASLQ